MNIVIVGAGFAKGVNPQGNAVKIQVVYRTPVKKAYSFLPLLPNASTKLLAPALVCFEQVREGDGAGAGIGAENFGLGLVRQWRTFAHASHSLPRCHFWEAEEVPKLLNVLILLVQLGGLEPPTS